MKCIWSYYILLIGYKEKLSINLKDKKIFVFLNIGFILLILFFILGYVIYLDLNFYNDFIMMNLLDIFLYLVLVFFLIIIYEFIYGIFFKLGIKEKVCYKFYGWVVFVFVEGIYFYKNYYILIGIVLFMIIILLFVVFIYLFLMYFFGLYIILVIYIVGCVGDFYVILKFIRCVLDIFIYDYGIGMIIYKK